ncbi:MAG: response regulator transcription factor [Thermoanaerobaculia bacterium]|nr:response regulator transcription factor [Thermoanaerobaculia bacterium]
MIDVFLVEDHAIVREGLRSLLDLVDDVRVVGEAADGEAAVAEIPALRPDVVLLDLRMPKLDGLGVLHRLSASGELPPTLILTTFDDDAGLFAALRAGARGFLLKDVSLDGLTHAIRTLAAGGTMIQPAVTHRALQGLGDLRHDFESLDPPDPLTERETEILRLMAGGYSNREIAAAFELAEGTVKNHISSVLSKLGVRDRTRAVLKAFELGLIS